MVWCLDTASPNVDAKFIAPKREERVSEREECKWLGVIFKTF